MNLAGNITAPWTGDFLDLAAVFLAPWPESPQRPRAAPFQRPFSSSPCGCASVPPSCVIRWHWSSLDGV